MAAEKSSASAAMVSKTKKKAAAKKAAAKKTVSADQIAAVAHKIENLDYAGASALVQKGHREGGMAMFQMGGALSVIYTNGWYKEENANFKVYVSEVFGVKPTSAFYAMRVYQKIIELGIPGNVIDTIGWTKFRLIERVVTKANWKSWVKKAHAVNTATLEDMVKKAQKGTVEGGTAATPTEVTRVTIPFYPDQKEVWDEAIKNAKAEADTEHTNVAACGLAQAYLGGTSAVKSKKGEGDLRETVKAHTPEEILAMVEDVYPHVECELTVYDNPAEKAPAPAAKKKAPQAKKKVNKKKS